MKASPLKILFVLLFVGAIGLALVWGYTIPWTGFGGYFDSKGDYQREKTLWDWMGLLIIPSVLVVGGFLLNRSERRGQEKIELDRQRQAILDRYFGDMTDLLLKEKLRDRDVNPEVRSIARTRTLVSLRILDSDRKAQALQFLFESGLILKNPTISLNGADLSAAGISNATLQGTELRGVHFERADLNGAQFSNADVRGSDFTGADLNYAKFNGANLIMCILRDAQLLGADFSDADLTLADLTHANVSLSQLGTAKSLKDATLPDGTLYEMRPVSDDQNNE